LESITTLLPHPFTDQTILADDPWVKDGDWAIAHKIRGFAGYPLAVGDRVVGVLATFSLFAISV
jgi:GAF domain-containing protein